MVFYPHLEIAPPRAELLHTQKEDSPSVSRRDCSPGCASPQRNGLTGGGVSSIWLS